MKPYCEKNGCTIYHGDCREVLGALGDGIASCCVTSPPYFHQRDYGVEDQIGTEASVDAYVTAMVFVFEEVRRVLRDGSTLWLNIGDKWNNYNGNAGPGSMRCRKKNDQRPEVPSGYGLECKNLKPKDLLGVPWRTALALQKDGWWLRSDIIWAKPSPIPESVRDRPTASHEHLFLLANSERYHFDFDAWKEKAVYAGQPRGGSTNRYEQNAAGMDNKVYDYRNRRDVWTVRPSTHDEHKATFPAELISPCIVAGCTEGETVIDPFLGSGTTLAECLRLGRRCIGVEINERYCEIAAARLDQGVLF